MTDTILVVLICTMLSALAWASFMLFRNSVVYSIRTDILHSKKLNHIYDKLPEYDYMMWQFNLWTAAQYVEKYDGNEH